MFRRKGSPRRKRMDSDEAIALVALGIFLGTIFTFGMRYWNQPITREEAVFVDAVFSGYEEKAGHEKAKVRLGNRTIITGSSSAVPIILTFSDHEALEIDGSCVNDALRTQLQGIPSGTRLSCAVHPHHNTVIEIIADGRLLMDFDETVARLSSEQRGFFAFGIVMYVGALYGLMNLLPRRRR